MNWSKTKNISNMPAGNYRSILGYAGESIAIGRALVCGYNLFFKAWRDSKYDAVLDAEGILYRVEIKQTSVGKTLSVTSGARSGAQISRDAPQRTQVLSQKDCDFLIGVHSLNGECWIIPIEYINILKKDTLTISSLEIFKEKWSIFSAHHLPVTPRELQIGFVERDIPDLEALAKKLGVDLQHTQDIIELTKRIKIRVNRKEKLAYEIWRKIFEMI